MTVPLVYLRGNSVYERIHEFGFYNWLGGVRRERRERLEEMRRRLWIEFGYEAERMLG